MPQLRPDSDLRTDRRAGELAWFRQPEDYVVPLSDLLEKGGAFRMAARTSGGHYQLAIHVFAGLFRGLDDADGIPPIGKIRSCLVHANVPREDEQSSCGPGAIQ